MVYCLQTKEIQAKLQELIEKLEINLQFDKAKLIMDLVTRVKTLLEAKRINTDVIFNTLYIIMSLAHSPSQTNIDIEMMRERFEERYIKIESGKIIKNIKFELKDFISNRPRLIEPVNYNSESSNEVYSDEEQQINNQVQLKENHAEVETNNKHIQETKLKNKMDDIFDPILVINLREKLLDSMRVLPINISSLLKTYLLDINFRLDSKTLTTISNFYKTHYSFRLKEYITSDLFYYSQELNDKHIVDSDYLLGIVLTNLANFDLSTIEDKHYFLNKLEGYFCLDISKLVFEQIIHEFNQIRHSLNIMRQIELVMDKYDIKSLVFSKFCYFIRSFLSCHDKILNAFNIVLNFQKGKVIVKDGNKLDLGLKSNESFKFIDFMLNDAEFFLDKFTDKVNKNKNKLSLFTFFNYYRSSILPQIKILIYLSEQVMLIKNSLISSGRPYNDILVKEFLDLLFKLANFNSSSEINDVEHLFKLELFLHCMIVYLNMVFEFMLEGNLIDINNEFFIDHMFTRKDNTKIIHNFNEKFQVFSWLNSFSTLR